MADRKNTVSVDEPISAIEAVHEARQSGVPEEALEIVFEDAQKEHDAWERAKGYQRAVPAHALADLDTASIVAIRCVESFPIWNGPRENGDRAGQNLRCDVLLLDGTIETTFDAATDLKHAEDVWTIIRGNNTQLGEAKPVNFIGKDDGQQVSTTQTPGGYFYANLRRLRAEAERAKLGSTEDFVADDLSNMS